MTFDYPDISTTSHNNQRWYDTPHGWYPSITTILGHTVPDEKRLSLQNWRDGVGHEEADRITQEAADHGTMVHLLCERHLKGQQVDAPIDGQAPTPKALAAYNALKFKLRRIRRVYGQEVALFSKRFEVAGRCDVVGEYDSTPAIIDFKTSRSIKGDERIHDYKVQLAFYGAAHNEMFGTTIEDGVVLMASDVGFPQEFHFKLADFYPELASRATSFWHAAVNSTT